MNSSCETGEILRQIRHSRDRRNISTPMVTLTRVSRSMARWISKSLTFNHLLQLLTLPDLLGGLG